VLCWEATPKRLALPTADLKGGGTDEFPPPYKGQKISAPPALKFLPDNPAVGPMLQNPSPRPATAAEPPVRSQTTPRRSDGLTEPSKLQAAAQDARLIERLLLSPQVLHSDARRIAIVASMLKACLREIENGSRIVSPVVVTPEFPCSDDVTNKVLEDEGY